ncbi:hypothetical protein LCGC14_2997810, partial [marine sediment metagenome]
GCSQVSGLRNSGIRFRQTQVRFVWSGTSRVVAVPQTFGNAVRVHPHTHCLASRGIWNEQGQWTPVPYIDTLAAEKLFAHKVIRFLKNKGLVSDERIELLRSFRHSGFSVDCSVTVWHDDTAGLQRFLGHTYRRAT